MPSLFFFFSLSPRGTGRKELCPPPFVGRGGRGSLCLFDPLWPPFFSLSSPLRVQRERGPPRMQALPFRPLLLTSLSPCPPLRRGGVGGRGRWHRRGTGAEGRTDLAGLAALNQHLFLRVSSNSFLLVVPKAFSPYPSPVVGRAISEQLRPVRGVSAPGCRRSRFFRH